MANVYDRGGRLTRITNGATVSVRAYNAAGQLLGESYAGGPLNGLAVSNRYDGLLRRTNVSLFNGGARLAQTGFGYDAASRLLTVGDGTNSAT